MLLRSTRGHTPDCFRHGATDLFAALDVSNGKVLGKCYAQHRAKDLRSFLREIDKSVPPELEIHVVIDNLSA